MAEERLEPTGANVVRVLAESLVNVALIRNTLSTHVRVKLQKGTFPWLLLDGWDIMNNIHDSLGAVITSSLALTLTRCG